MLYLKSDSITIRKIQLIGELFLNILLNFV